MCKQRCALSEALKNGCDGWVKYPVETPCGMQCNLSASLALIDFAWSLAVSEA